MTFQHSGNPRGVRDQVESMREVMVEAAAEANDELMNAYLDEGDLSEDDIKRGLSRAHAGE